MPEKQERVWIKILFKELGGHVHCRMFTAKDPSLTYAKNGDLAFSIEEWPCVMENLAHPRTLFVNETPVEQELSERSIG